MQDSIMLWVANEEAFYNDVRRLYDRWLEEGEGWDEADARKEAYKLVVHIAEAIEIAQRGYMSEPYSGEEKWAAANEIIDDFEEYREEAIAETVKVVQMKPDPKDLETTPEDIEYLKQQEKMILKVGLSLIPGVVEHPVNVTEGEAKKNAIEHIRGYMPVSAQKIRQALERGDKHLNTIPLRKWDDMAKMMGYRNRKMSLSDAVGVLKHVAKWHYA